jgi:hypothetical protein
METYHGASQQKQSDRRDFIGGSDARIIMGQDEKALIRLWQEKLALPGFGPRRPEILPYRGEKLCSVLYEREMILYPEGV